MSVTEYLKWLGAITLTVVIIIILVVITTGWVLEQKEVRAEIKRSREKSYE
jgi:heme/copper-type cytochrome/quinol oxidase subunit 4